MGELFNRYSEYMMEKVKEQNKEIVIGGENYNNLRYNVDIYSK